MKLSEIKPCGSCGSPLIGQGKVKTWYLFCASAVVLDDKVARAVVQNRGLGLDWKLAEACAPKSGEAILIAGEQNPEAFVESHVCEKCAAEKSLTGLMGAVRDREELGEARSA